MFAAIRRGFPGCRPHRSRWASWNCVRQERPLFDAKGFQSASDRSYTSRHHPLGRGNLVIWRKVHGRARLHAVAGGLSSCVASSGSDTDCFAYIVDMCIPQTSIRGAPCRNLVHPLSNIISGYFEKSAATRTTNVQINLASHRGFSCHRANLGRLGHSRIRRF